MMKKYKKIVQDKLEYYFNKYKVGSSYSEIIWDAMAYTTLLDGKRLRAIMALEIAQIFNLDMELALPCACSLEIMHAYSLIHDDLPCMDNDDLRRGKPTNHKVFGEAIAVLAGDGLISFGSQILIDELKGKIDSNILLEVVNDYNKTAGAMGIIAGQVADIEAEKKEIDIDNLKYIHKFKTGALFKFAILICAKISKIGEDKLNRLSEYADNFGILFQVYDDIIDATLTTQELGKTAGKDSIANKLTYVSAYGIKEAKNIFYSLVELNHDILNEIGIKSVVFDSIYELLSKKMEK